jgi:phage FluMu gp28-like protein
MKEFLRRLAEKGWRPHAGQEAYLRATARFRVLACGRRWGKTEAAAADLASRIVGGGPSRQLAIAPTVSQAKIVFERVAWMLTAAGITFLPQVTPHPTIRVHEGGDSKAAVLHVLDARSGHERRYLRGLGSDHILIDEAAYVPDELIADTAMPMLATTGGRMTLISTPNGRNHFYRYFMRGQRGEEGFWSHTGPSSENPMVDPNYLELQQSVMTERTFGTEYLAEFHDSNTAAFGYEFIQAALEAPAVPHGMIAVGADWARHKDFTAVVAIRGTPRNAEVLACEAWRGLTWATSIAKTFEFAKAHGAREVLGDETGLGGIANEDLQRIAKGCKVKGFVFTRPSKHALISNLTWMLEQGRLRLPADADLIEELQAYELTATDTLPKYGASHGHDDRVCALALACAALSKSGGGIVKGVNR